MIEWTIYSLSYVLIVSGAFFIVVGAVGLVRMPDLFTRMHAISVTETAGAGLLLVGLMLIFPMLLHHRAGGIRSIL